MAADTRPAAPVAPSVTLLGREEAVRRAVLALDGAALVLHGPRGSGRSSVLETAVGRAAERVAVVRCSGAQPGDRPGSAMQHLVCEFPADVLADLPTTARETLLGTQWAREGRADEAAAALHRLLSATASTRSLAVVVDDVDLVDPASAAVLAPTLYRAHEAGLLGLLLTTSTRSTAAGTTPAGGGVGRPGWEHLPHLALSPLPAQDVIGLLGERGHRSGIALWAYRESGGLPALALAVAECSRDGRPPSAEEMHDLVRTRLLGVPAELRPTLHALAAMHRPSLSSLERAGVLDAAAGARAVLDRGLAVLEDAEIRLVPSGLGPQLLEEAGPARAGELHAALARTAPTTALRLRHLALADAEPDDELARALAEQAHRGAIAGRHDLAAELYLLAAMRSTWSLDDDRAEWLTRCVEAGVVGGSGRVLARALAESSQLGLSPARSVRTRVALLELELHRPLEVDEAMAAALAEAGDEPLLLSLALLQRAKLLLATADLAGAHALALRAAELARSVPDAEREGEALTVAASVGRALGEPASRELLARALVLSGRPRLGAVHLSPPFVGARWAMQDDDLHQARRQLLDLLATAGPEAGHDQVHVLRSLVEVHVRMGRAREALVLADRTMRAALHFGLPVSPGWYAATIAELTGGTFEQARVLATRGIALATERGDERYLRRHLAGLGAAQLLLADATGSAQTFRRLVAVEERDGLADLTTLRWHADAVCALVAAGASDEAAELLARSRSLSAAGRSSASADAMLDRAEAELCAVRGQVGSAGALAQRSALVLLDLGQPVEATRSLVSLGVVERRVRHGATSRAAFAQARAVVDPEGPWAVWVDEHEHRGPTPVEPHPSEPGEGVVDLAALGLSPMEQLVAREVALGRSNREIAQALHLSVKTVEGTLTRSYRKLGVRSRTQLTARVLLRPSR